MDIKKKIFNYFNEILGITVTLKAITKIAKAPLILNTRYRFYKLSMLNHNFIIVEPKDTFEISPAELKKHMEMIRKIAGFETILFLDQCAAYIRSRLISYKLPFIVPGKHMYLPDLMIDLRGHFADVRKKQDYLSPSAQALLLFKLQRDVIQPFNPGNTGINRSYTKMTMTRAVDELIHHGLCRTEKEGRTKLVWFNYRGKDLWKNALPLLRSPVKRTIYLRGYPKWKGLNIYRAGIEALASFTMISADNIPVYAINKGEFIGLEKRKAIAVTEFKEEAALKMELWNYDPMLLSEGKVVDTLSLYLSLKDSPDERVQDALDEIVKGFKWQ